MPKRPSRTNADSGLTYIGIDPGANGGIITMSRNQFPIGLHKIPDTIGDLAELFRTIAIPSENGKRMVAYVEKVQGYIGRGREAPGSAMFNFGQGYGTILMGLTMARIPYNIVSPHIWQRYFKIPPHRRKQGESHSEFKNRLKDKAQQLFPRLKVTLWNADALLIAEYARTTHKD